MFLGLVAVACMGVAMEYRMVGEKEIKIIGVERKTTNEGGKAAREIPGMWANFLPKTCMR